MPIKKTKAKSTGYPIEIKSYAKMLYLERSAKTGDRLLTNTEICRRIESQFGVKPTSAAMTQWVKAGGWDVEYQIQVATQDKKSTDLDVPYGSTERYINAKTVRKAMLDHAQAALFLQSHRLRKYGKIEDDILTMLLGSVKNRKKSPLKEDGTPFKEEAPDAYVRALLSNFANVQKGVSDSSKSFLTMMEKLEKMFEEKKNEKPIEPKSDQIWEHEPVDIYEFFNSKEFLGNISEGFFKCVKDDIINIFNGNPRLLFKSRRYEEIIFKEAYGSGKSVRASIIITYLVYLLLCLRNPLKYFNLLPGTKITITNVSVSKKQAKDVVFHKMKGLIDNCPWFSKHGYMYDPNNKLELRFDPSDSAKVDPNKIYKNLYVIPGSSSEFSALGYDVICAIIDEATAYGIENGKDKAETIYDTLRGRVSSRFPKCGMLLMAGNPHHVDDFLERRIREIGEDHPEVYIIKNRSIWEAKMPDYDGDWFYFDTNKMKIVDEIEKDKEDVIPIPEIYRNDFDVSPEKSTRNLAGISLETISRFVTNIEKIDEMFVNSGRKNPIKEISGSSVIFDEGFGPVNLGAHAVHVDSGITHDACSISLGHIYSMKKGTPCFWVDCIIRLEGSLSNPTILEDVRSIIYQLTDLGFPIQFVSYDGYQSTDSLQILTRKGYTAFQLSVDKTIGPYTDMRQALYEGRINCPVDDYLRYELRTLENVNGKKVDHPLHGSKDSSDSVCGMISSLINKVPPGSIVLDEVKVKGIVKEEKEKRSASEIFDDRLRDIESGGGHAVI